MDTATLDGADLNCVGQCSITGSQLTGSAPINIQTDGTLTITDSNIAGSRTDEDIVAHDTAGLTYTSSTGTGGDTDAWIRLLSERIIQTNGEGIKVVGWSSGGEATEEVIEAIEIDNSRILAVQWHPELLPGADPIFSWLTDQAAK